MPGTAARFPSGQSPEFLNSLRIWKESRGKIYKFVSIFAASAP